MTKEERTVAERNLIAAIKEVKEIIKRLDNDNRS
jgi:hypothetical protein